VRVGDDVRMAERGAGVRRAWADRTVRLTGGGGDRRGGEDGQRGERACEKRSAEA
jgi:hypothetical protein